MNHQERFLRMTEVEERLKVLCDEDNWYAEQITYEDIEGEPFRVHITLRYDILPPEEGYL